MCTSKFSVHEYYGWLPLGNGDNSLEPLDSNYFALNLKWKYQSFYEGMQGRLSSYNEINHKKN